MDYKLLSEQGLTSRTASEEDLGEMDKSIAFLTAEVEKLELEEKRAQLQLQIKEKMKNIERLNTLSNASGVLDFTRSTSTNVPVFLGPPTVAATIDGN